MASKDELTILGNRAMSARKQFVDEVLATIQTLHMAAQYMLFTGRLAAGEEVAAAIADIMTQQVRVWQDIANAAAALRK